MAYHSYQGQGPGPRRHNIDVISSGVRLACAAIYLIFACLKIHGIRVKRNKMLGAYIGFHYALFFIYMILFVVGSVMVGIVYVAILAFWVLFFILDGHDCHNCIL